VTASAHPSTPYLPNQPRPPDRNESPPLNAATNNNPCPTTPVIPLRALFTAQFNDKPVRILADTGSAVDLATASIIPDKKLKEARTSIRMANGSTATTTGRAKIKISINNNVVNIRPHIMDTLDGDFHIVLGYATLSQWGAAFDCTAHTIRFLDLGVVSLALPAGPSTDGVAPVGLRAPDQPPAEPAVPAMPAPPQSSAPSTTPAPALPEPPSAPRTATNLAVIAIEAPSQHHKQHPPVEDLLRAAAPTPEWTDLLLEFKDCFGTSLDPNKYINTPEIKLDINPDITSSWVPQYKTSLQQGVVIHQELMKQLAAGALARLDPAERRFNSAILAVERPDRPRRICVDMTHLNKWTYRTDYRGKPITELWNNLASMNCWATFDGLRYYFQFRVRREDWPYCAITCPCCGERFAYTRAAMGHSASAAAAQRFSDTLIAGLADSDSRAGSLLDDFGLSGRTDPILRALTRRFLLRCRAAGVVLNALKICIKTEPDAIKYLGRLISFNSIRILPEHQKMIDEWPLPSNRTLLKSFLGAAQFIAGHLPDVQQHFHNLSDLTRTGTKYSPLQTHIDSFNAIRASVYQAIALAVPVHGELFTVTSDASDKGMGWSVSQCGRVIAIGGCKYTQGQAKWVMSRKEALAALVAIQRNLHLLAGQQVHLLIDSKIVVSLLNKRPPAASVVRLVELLSSLGSWRVDHLKGTDNVISDCISRCDHLPAPTSTDIDDDVPQIIGDTLAYQQIPDDDFPTHSAATTPATSATSTAAATSSATTASTLSSATSAWSPASFRARLQQSYADDPILTRHGEPASPYTNCLQFRENLWFWIRPARAAPRLYIPSTHNRDLVTEILQRYHDEAAHPGIAKTTAAIGTAYYWVRWFTDVKEYVSACEWCLRHKCNTNPSPGQQLALPPAPGPWSSVALDHAHMPTAEQAAEPYDSALVAVCMYSRNIVVIPAQKSDTSARTISRLTEKLWFRFGFPRYLQFDHSSIFSSAEFKQWCTAHAISHNATTASHQSANGIAEGSIRVWKAAVTGFSSTDIKHWPSKIAAFEHLHNNTRSASHSHTPFEVVHAYSATREEALVMPAAAALPLNEYMERRQTAITLHDDYIVEAKARAEHKANATRKPHHYEIGDLVMINHEPLLTDIERALPKSQRPKYAGPFRLLERVRPNTFTIQLPSYVNKHTVNEFNTKKFKPFHSTSRFASRPYYGRKPARLLSKYTPIAVTADKIDHGVPVLRVHFKDLPPHRDQWMARELIVNYYPQLVTDYEKLKYSKPIEPAASSSKKKKYH
jgi:hypothetical protein